MTDFSLIEVTPAEIEEQRAKGWPDFHPEDYCHRCGGRNIKPWGTRSSLWNLADPSRVKILCPQCFVEAYEAATGESRIWYLVPDGDSLADDKDAVERAARVLTDSLNLVPNLGPHPWHEVVRRVLRAAEGEQA